MYILPLVELQGGESVHVLDAPSLGETRPLIDPVEVVHRLQGMGAQGLHVVDVDRAANPGRDNDAALVSILDTTVLPVEAGGGVGSLKRIQELLDTGVKRVLVGTMGVLHQDWLKEAGLIFRDALIACVDVRDRDLVVKGRTERASTRLEEHVDTIDGYGLEALHLTYLGENGSGIALAESLARRLRTPLTYQGPIGGPTDLARLEQAGVRGVVLGPEIYDGRLQFGELAKAYRVQ